MELARIADILYILDRIVVTATSTMWANKLLHLQKRLKPLVTSNFLTLPVCPLLRCPLVYAFSPALWNVDIKNI